MGIQGSDPQAAGFLHLPDYNSYPIVLIKASAFNGCSGLTGVRFPYYLRQIEDAAFAGCSGLTSVDFPSSLTSIGQGAFAGCSGLTNVTIPNTLSSVAQGAFIHCSRLTNFTVDITHPSYSSTNGVLLSKDRTALLAFPAGKIGVYTIPSSVTSISQYAFIGCSGLSGVFFQGKPPSIDTDGFLGLNDMTVYYIQGTEGWGSSFGGRPTSTAVPPSAPTITFQPLPWTIIEGSPAYLAVAATGTGPLFYQWSKDGVSILGATHPVLSFATPAAADAGLYQVTVSNRGGGVISQTARLTIAPIITFQPLPLTVLTGSPAYFAVTVIGTDPLTYQWNKDGINIAEANQSILGLATTTAADSGLYQVTVSNSAGFVTSEAARLIVKTPPVPPIITFQPVPVTVTAGSAASFTVTATGTDPLAYQWSKDGVSIAEATTQTLSIAATTVADAGLYRVTVSNSMGFVSSQPARLTVNVPIVAPTITLQPLPSTIFAGSPAYFAVAAIGTAPLFYQWSRDGANIVEATNQIFSLAGTTVADAGLYRVTISNSGGTVVSQTARLTVNIPPVVPTSTLVLQVSSSFWNPTWVSVATNRVPDNGPRRFYQMRASVVEVASDLKNPVWIPVATNNILNEPSQRFYRLVAQ